MGTENENGKGAIIAIHARENHRTDARTDDESAPGRERREIRWWRTKQREKERERERALRSEKPTSSERRMKKEGREGREAAAGAIPRKLESRNRPPLEVRQGARAVAVVGAFVRFSRTAVVRRNELQFASKASHHRRAPSTWEGGRASAHRAGLPLDALSNCKPPLQEDRSHEAIQRTTKLCFEVHQPNLTAEAAGLRTARHHPIIPQTSERGREGGRLFFSKSEQMPTRALPARGLARGRGGRRTCSLLPPRRHKNHAALAGTRTWLPPIPLKSR